ncbi:MAG: acetyl-CoA synthetase [Monoraphidium minutum]|nr:MAG: acetyl-CoA synthetase [Monoraphidium minutum]
MHARSLRDPAGFWADEAEDYHWHKKWEPDHHAFNFDLRRGRVSSTWFRGGRTNISYNCLDRWVIAGAGGRPAFISEGNDLGHERRMTYHQALVEVCRVANWLKGQGVTKGDAVLIYMPMVCELPIAMLACARIGAVHSVVFAGFSAESMAQRIQDCGARVVITASGVMRATKRVDLKALVDDALRLAERGGYRAVRRVLVFEKSALPREQTPWTPHRDSWWHDEIPGRPEYCPLEWLDAEDPLFMLYTSGSTGKPKGVLHTVGGYMVHTGAANKYVFDVRPGDVYWCTADCGWITGHSFLAYGPLLRGATVVIFGSTPAHPDPGRCWRIVEKYRVRQFFTAPTLIRALMQHGDAWVTAHDRSSLRMLGTAGEPINPHAWRWYHDVVGEGRCPVMDNWWQTETGGPMMTPLPYAWALKPGSATLPFFGVDPVLLDAAGREMAGPGEGVLAIRRSWPGIMRTLFGDHERFEQTYFSAFKGLYFTGDGVRRDEDGYYWITGRVDDVINVSGHRIGTAEVESALASHPACAEAAIVSVPHDVKGESVYAYVVLFDGAAPDDAARRGLLDLVRSQIGAFAAPDVIQWAPGLPKTRSGKIMRRILKNIALGRFDELGDTSGLAEPQIVDVLIEGRKATM